MEQISFAYDFLETGYEKTDLEFLLSIHVVFIFHTFSKPEYKVSD